MKLKPIKKQLTPVTCSYCKNKTATHTVHGVGYGGKTICNECCEKERLKAENDKEVMECSLGEEQLYRTFGVY